MAMQTQLKKEELFYSFQGTMDYLALQNNKEIFFYTSNSQNGSLEQVSIDLS